MAEQDILDLVGDGEKQIQAVIERLKEMLSLVKDINANQIKIESKTSGSGSVKDLRANIDELNKTQAEFARTLQELKKQEDAIIQTQAKLNASYYEEAKAVAALKVEHQERMRQINEEAKANNANYQQRKALEKAQKEHAKSMQAINKASEREAKELQKAWEAYTREQEKKRIAEEKAAAAAAKAAQPYNRLNDLHKRLVEHAQQLGAKYGVTSKEFENASNRANNLGKKLSEIDAKLGNHRRNVGNYASAWNGLQHQMGLVLRELPNVGISLNTFVLSLSNNLPMLFDEIKKVNEQNKILAEQGKKTVPVLRQMLQSILSWQTLLIVGVTLITKYGDAIWEAFNKGKKEIDEFNKAVKESRKRIDDLLTKDLSRMTILTKIIKDQSQSLSDRTKAIEELQKAYPTTFGQIEKHKLLEGELGDAINKTTEALIARSMAMAAEEEFDLLNKRIRDLKKQEEELVSKRNLAEVTIINNQLKASDAAGFKAAKLANEYDRADKALTRVRANISKLGNDQQRLLDEIRGYNKASRGLFLGQPDSEKPNSISTRTSYDPFSDEIKSQSEYLKELAKLDEQRLRQEMEDARLVYENEQKSLKERLDAYRVYAYARTAILHASANAELDDTRNKLEEIGKLESRSNKTYTKAENDLLLQKQTLMVREKRLREQLQADILQVNREGVRGIRGIYDSEIKEVLSQAGMLSQELRDAEQEELIALSDRYKSGLVSLRQFHAERTSIRAKYDQLELTQIIAFLENEITLLEAQGADVTDVRRKVHEARLKLMDAEIKEEESNAKKSIEINRQVLSDIEKFTNNINQLHKEIANIYDDISQKRIDLIEKEGEAIDKNLQKELAAIDATVLAQDEKQRRIASAEAKAEAKRVANERRQIEQRRRAAAFEKAISISTILSTIPIMVVKAFNETTGPVWLKAAAAASAGLLGGAQLARAVAAPLPQYASGTDNAPEGLAIVGEKGRELKITPDGTVSLTPAKASLDYLKKGTKIIPADKTEKIISQIGMYGYPLIPINSTNDNSDKVIDAMDRQTRKLVNTLNRNNQPAKIDANINWALYLKNKINSV